MMWAHVHGAIRDMASEMPWMSLRHQCKWSSFRVLRLRKIFFLLLSYSLQIFCGEPLFIDYNRVIEREWDLVALCSWLVCGSVLAWIPCKPGFGSAHLLLLPGNRNKHVRWGERSSGGSTEYSGQMLLTFSLPRNPFCSRSHRHHGPAALAC